MTWKSSTLIVLLLAFETAQAVPGPATTAVVANANDPESVALATRYAEARSVPAAGVCVLDLPQEVDIALDAFEARWMAPMMDCLGPRADQIEAVLLVRGVPLRVGIPVDGETQRVSSAAAVSLWRTVMGNGRLMRGIAPGQTLRCADSPCLAPRFANPYREGAFESGWQRFAAGVNWRPVLVTMLHGRSAVDAGGLLESALEGERVGGVEGTFLLMRGGDPARSALDEELEPVASALGDLGIEAEVVPFDSALTGRHLGAFVTGSAQLGDVIEGNTFAPGALVDNLTSYGALPVNFMAEGQQQVSIARWVAQGVAGVHGTTDEPLSHVFPSRQFLVDYGRGMTLAESYHRNLPFAYWRNLVLGDPMAAPYAARPRVSVGGLVDGEVLEAGAPISVAAEPIGDHEIESLTVYIDGVSVGAVEGDALDLCLRAPARPVQILAVAQTGGDYPAKGWTAYSVTGAGAEVDCPAPPDAAPPPDVGATDMGIPDANSPPAPDQSVDVGPTPEAGVTPSLPETDASDGGCVAGGANTGATLLFWVVLLGLRRR